MTAAEIVMTRDDPNIAWGFRLTGGADLGTPFYVVKVLGRGHAERAGLQVGDMVYAINNKYINKFSHKDAQNAILHTGNTLTLNIRRGTPTGRGTPLPEYIDPLMGLVPAPPTPRPKPVPPPPYEPPLVIKQPTPPPESEEEEEAEETVAAFNVKINPKGRIAAIEELPVTPPPSRSSSRCRSRSRSMSRDRRRSASTKRETTNTQRQQGVQNEIGGISGQQQQGVQNGIGGISGPGESFTYSKEVLTQYSTVLSASNQTGGHMSENINESFIIHGGSERKMEDVLSPEDIERDIFEEKLEEQKITELLTGEAELLDKGVVGINFRKIIPKTDFIKDSNVFKELQDQCVKKEESEEEQLKKDPNKRFSTFLQTPKRPIPKPKYKPPSSEDVHPESQATTLQTKQHLQTVQQEQTFHSSTTTVTESVNIVEEVTFQEVHEISEDRGCNTGLLMVPDEEGGPVITEAVSTENVSEEKVRFQEEEAKRYNIEEYKEQTSTEEQKIETVSISHSEKEEESSTVVYKSEFERQLAEIKKQMEAIQQLPSILQANLAALQEQLAKVIEAKAAADQKEVDVPMEENKVEQPEECVQEDVPMVLPEKAEIPEKEEIDNTATDLEDNEVQETMANGLHEQYENMKNQNYFCQREDDEISVTKPPMIRNFPQKGVERPIVLPGGRKWYKPRDAYNEDFIAETIINQSEVLVGSTIGLNFRKYEPPKFDAANSSVFRLVQELEGKCYSDHSTRQPIDSRPEKVFAGEDFCTPISKRHFFAARLSEQQIENIEKVLKDTNEQEIIAV